MKAPNKGMVRMLWTKIGGYVGTCVILFIYYFGISAHRRIVFML